MHQHLCFGLTRFWGGKHCLRGPDGSTLARWLLFGCLASTTLCGSSHAEEWWRQYTTIASHPSGKDLELVSAECFRAAGGYGGWYGFWYYDFQDPDGDGQVESGVRVRNGGARPLPYFDVGEIGDFAVIVDEYNEIVVHAWNWQEWDGEEGTPRWFGLQAFMENVDWAPFPTEEDYSLPPFTRPGGAPIPEGELYEVLTRRWIDGTWHPLDTSSDIITDEFAQASGLAEISHKQESAPEIQGGTGWVMGRLPQIDRTNPQMVEYHCREIREFIKRFKPAGIHIDNLADSNIFCPSVDAFGQWSSHTFRQFLRTRASEEQLRAWGIDDINGFEIRDYMLAEYEGGNKMGGAHLTNERWLDDPVWKAYLVHKTESGLEYGRQVYKAAKEAAAEIGIDCCVFGNIIPLFPGSELVDGFCDIAHFEWMSEGAYPRVPELGLPPRARSAYVVRLGRAISDVSYCWPSLYVPKRLTGEQHVNLHKVQAFECFANGGIMDYGQWYMGNYSPGTDESAGFVNRFINAAAPEASGRDFCADVGVVYCPWTYIAAINGQGPVPELFLYEYKGWCDFLCDHHYQWDVLLSQHMSAETLERFKVVVLPSMLCITDAQREALAEYIRNGGRVVATGQSGTRFGVEGFLTSRQTNILDALEPESGFHRTAESPGCAYFLREHEKALPALSSQLEELLLLPTEDRTLAAAAPRTVGLSLWRSVDGTRLFLDAVNMDLEVETDVLTPAPGFPVDIAIENTSFERPTNIRCLEAADGREPEWKDVPAEAWEYDRGSRQISLEVSGFTHYVMYSVQ